MDNGYVGAGLAWKAQGNERNWEGFNGGWERDLLKKNPAIERTSRCAWKRVTGGQGIR
jgi:hypothetical protein